MAVATADTTIEAVHNRAYVRLMSAKAAKTVITRSSTAGLYRGVKLQAPAKAPKIALAKLQRAVRSAVAKNAQALAGGK